MSRIFDAANRGESEVSKLLLPMVDEPQPPAPVESEVRRAAPVEAPQAPPIQESFPAQIRTVRLRVPAPSPILPFEDGQWQANEQYRILRTKIGHHRKQPRVLVVSSPAPRDGKSVSAINTAGALALKSEAKVLLVDADFRRSSIHVQLGIPGAPGLSDVLSGACGVEQALVQTEEFPNLCVLPAGTPPANPVELLDSPQWPALVSRLRGLFRYAVMDSPPVAAVADYDLIQAACDGVILVVRPDHTNRMLLRKALETVAKEKFLGVLLNCVPDWFLTRRASSYYYYSGQEAYRSEPTE